MGYRLDIQLLRAFAVILVVLYHLEVAFFSKGFLGVDIFFVISGFLMAILYKKGQPLEFLKRRVRRLLPPYVAVLLLTMLVGMFVLLPNELSQLNEQSIYSAVFAANIGFWTESTYFNSSGFNPLLHLWTLGAEAQYYLLVPLILWLFYKKKISILILALGSFALCAVVIFISPKTSFFMMPLRAWEFLIGAMAGLYFTNVGAIRNQSYSWVGLLGIVGLLATQFLPVDGNKFSFVFGHPGLTALLTCFATMIVVIFGLPDKILASNIVKPFIYIGKISYSIYLVHFPIIVFYFYQPFDGTVLSKGSSLDTLVLLALIGLSSVFSYYFIEKRGSKLNQGLLAGIAALAVVALLVVSDAVINNRFNPYQLGFLGANQDRDQFRCGTLRRAMDPYAKTCLLKNRSDYDKSIFLVGNSHADSIKKAFNEVAGQYGYNTYITVDNAPLAGGMSARGIIEEAVSNGVNIIVTHHKSGTVKPETYLDLQKLAAEEGITLITIAPVPVYEEHILKYLYQTYKSDRPIQSLLSREDHVKNISADLGVFRDMITNNISEFRYYDPTNYFCDSNCKFIDDDGRAYYFDRHHLTLTGSKQLIPLFKELFENLP